MTNFLEPNIHPVLVHFSYALIITAALLYVVATFFGTKKSASLLIAANWMLALGAIAIVATVMAGFQAFYSVNHDVPSHASMLTHRSWALISSSVVLVLAVWRWQSRQKSVSRLFSAAMVVAALLVSVTAWWGGKLVYVHGLGVASLPEVTGDGHDHEHGDDGHDKAASILAKVTSSEIDMTSATSVVDGFQEALKSGDKALVESLMAPGVVIAEGGNAEWSFAEYRDHHMEADMAQTGSDKAVVERTVHRREIIDGGDTATVITHSQLDGKMGEKEFHYRMMETMVVRRTEGKWKIAHIHWSAAPIKDEEKSVPEPKKEDDHEHGDDHEH